MPLIEYIIQNTGGLRQYYDLHTAQPSSGGIFVQIGRRIVGFIRAVVRVAATPLARVTAVQDLVRIARKAVTAAVTRSMATPMAKVAPTRKTAAVASTPSGRATARRAGTTAQMASVEKRARVRKMALAPIAIVTACPKPTAKVTPSVRRAEVTRA